MGKKIIISFILTLLFSGHLALAQSLGSTNYQINDSEFDSAGGVSSSTNYQSQDAMTSQDESQVSSTTFNLFSGFIKRSFPHVPGTPTLVNTGGSLSTQLDFVVVQGNGNASDVEYAIAISSDNFTTTSYVQADDTVGATTVWQTYTAWGGATGQRISGLTSLTTYKIKVKARYAANTETAFSSEASAATASGVQTFTFTISGVAAGSSVAGTTTTTDSTATGASFGTLNNNTNYTAAQILAVNTNSVSGYSVTASQDHSLRNSSSLATIGDFSGTASDNEGQGGFGYALQNILASDASFVYNASGRTFNSKGFQTTPVTVMGNAGSSNAQVYLVYRLRIDATQPSGGYSNQITYTGTANF